MLTPSPPLVAKACARERRAATLRPVGVRPTTEEGFRIVGGSEMPRGDQAFTTSPSSSRCLLDLDLDLAEELDSEVRRVARGAAIAEILEVDPGQVPLFDWLRRVSPGFGLLVLDGVLAINVQVVDRVAAELVGAGELIQTPSRQEDALLSCEVGCRALIPSRVALLDEGFARRVRFWPEISSALLRRVGQRAFNLDVQRAIAAQPRLEMRLALLLWHLAARWGKVELGGVRLPLPLTHQLLGRLVGAERPSVSHALTRLASAGLVTGHGDEWHLHERLRDRLPAMREPLGVHAERLASAVGSIGLG
jgi:CRP/FNR family cyclic AMP-dependent transcriptional regulator